MLAKGRKGGMNYGFIDMKDQEYIEINREI